MSTSSVSALPPNAGIAANITPLAALSLRDQAVTIGPILPEDTAAMFLWVNDVETLALDLSYRPVDWMSYHKWLENIGQNPSQVMFAIRRISDPKIVGFAELGQIDSVHRTAKFGLRIGSEINRGRGLGKAAARLVLNYAWKHLNLNRVHLSVLEFNDRAIRAYRAAGFEQEGRLRQAVFINGAWQNMVLMACLRSGEK